MNESQVKSLINKKKLGRHSVGNGLYLRVTNSGAYWAVRYSIYGKRREATLGKYPEMSLAKANLESAQIGLDVSEGRDPLTERKREDNTQLNLVDDLAEDWFKDCDNRLKYPNIPRQVYRDYIAPSIGQIPLDQITPRDIRATIQKAAKSGSKARANDALMYCKQLFRHGVKLDVMQTNPALPFTVQDAGGVEKSRDRALSLDELEQVFQVLRDNRNQFSRENYLAMVLLVSLGVRKGELIAAQWSEFDTEKALWHLPKERSKTGAPITVPLSPLVLGCLKELHTRAYNSDFVFPNRRVSKRFGHMSFDTLNAALKKLFNQGKMPVEHFTVHDLRRTFRSLLASLKVPGYVAERCLNHKLKGVQGVYDRYDYLEERKIALDSLSKSLLFLL